MVVGIVGIVEFVRRVVDHGVVTVYREGRFQKGFLGVVTIKKAMSDACSDDFRTSRTKCDVGKAPKSETLVDGVIGGYLKAKILFSLTQE